MLPLPLEYLSSVCEVKTIGNELISAGVINEITEEYLEVSDRSGSMPVVEFGTEVKINVFNSRQGFRVLTGNVYTSSIRFLRIVDIMSILDYERRHFFRVETKMYAWMTPDKLPWGEQEGETGQEEYRVTLHNLSLGGALMESNLEMKEGDRFSVKIKLGRGNTTFRCEVHRVEETGRGTWMYGCSFRDSSRMQNDALCAYIFQRQREHLNRQGG